MALPKITAPSPQAFDSDPIEQVYAKGVLDRDMSGLAFMFANAAQDRTGRGQQQYMQGLQVANAQAQQLAQEEERNKVMMEILKGSLDLAKNGYQPANMPSLNAVFNDVNAPDVREPSAAANALLRAKAQQALTSGSGAGGDKLDAHVEVDALGNIISQKFGAKGNDAARLAEVLRLRALAAKQAMQPGQPLAAPSIDSANKSATDAAKNRYPGR